MTSSRRPWTMDEDKLLRDLLHHTLPGGLNPADPPLAFPDIAAAMNKKAKTSGPHRRQYTAHNVHYRYYNCLRPLFNTPKEQAARELQNAYAASERAEKAAVRLTRSNSLESGLAKQARIAAEMVQDGAGMAAEVAAVATEAASQAASHATKEAKKALLTAARKAEMAVERAKTATDKAVESTRKRDR